MGCFHSRDGEHAAPDDIGAIAKKKDQDAISMPALVIPGSTDQSASKLHGLREGGPSSPHLTAGSMVLGSMPDSPSGKNRPSAHARMSAIQADARDSGMSVECSGKSKVRANSALLACACRPCVHACACILPGARRCPAPLPQLMRSCATAVRVDWRGPGAYD